MKLYTVPLLALAVAATGCATKKHVSREVGEINQKVERLAGELESTQERVRRNETRIAEVNQEAQAGVAAAQASAGEALGKAEQATQAAQAAQGKLIYTVTLSNDKVTFPLDRAEVSPEAQALIDAAIEPFKSANRGVYFEIEGHTDASGAEEYNLKLGEERALAVRNYLYDRHGFALNRMQVISYGEAKPVTSNDTRSGRAQNRRVVIKVIE